MLAIVILGSSSLLFAQLTGEGAIQGRLTDPTGAVIPGARVRAVNVATGTGASTTSTGAGFYLVTPLPPGTYTVTVGAKGFASVKQEHIVVDAARTVTLNLQLNIGSQSQQITVTDAPPALDTTDATLGETMENKTYSQLPLSMGGQQRDPTAFAGLMPGVGGGGRSGVFNGAGGPGGYTDEMYMDGIPITTISQQGDNRTVSLAVSVDAVDQFQVVTSGASAQYTGMGVQNFNIKSGTNQFHGSASDYIRNTAFDSWGFFAKAATEINPADPLGPQIAAPKPAEHQNELALTVGGPIRKDKLFFFVSYDKFHATSGVNPSLLSVPTALERQGNFTELNTPIYDPTTYQACTAANNGTPCAYQFHALVNGVDTPNVIPTGEISPISQYMQKFLPNPTGSGTQNNLLTGQPSGANNWELTAKVDYQMTPKQRISILSNSGVRGFIGYDYGSHSVLPAPYTNGIFVKELTSTGVLEHTYVITDHMVNDLKYAYVRQWGPAGNPWLGIKQYEAGSAVGIGNLPDGQAGQSFPNVAFHDFANAPSEWYSRNGYSQTVNTYDIMDNLQWTHGRHNFTFGFLWQWLSENESNWDTPSQPLGLNYSNVNTAGYSGGKIENTKTGNSYASFMLGAVNGTGIAVQPFSQLGARYHAFSPNVQDDWHVTSKLTLNLGLRWDIFTPYHEVLDRWSYLNMNAINPATGTPGAIEFVGNGSDSCHCRTPVNMYWGNIGPRLGLAYALDNKTVIRAAFGTSYSHAGGVGGRVGAQNGTGQVGLTGSAAFPSSGQAGAIPAFYLNPNLPAPYGNTSLPSYDASPFRDPTVNAGNYIDANGNAVTPQSVSYADPYLSGRAPYAENWNIGVERAITRNLTLNVNYSGSQSHFLTGGSRGQIINQINPKYEVLGSLLKQLPGSVDKATGQTYLQEAQAILPGISLPYAGFAGPHATIQAMLSPFPQYGGIHDTWGNVANANYNSLQLTLTRRPVHGVSFTLNYTYSKEIDDAGSYRTGWALPASAVTDGIARPQGRIDRSLGAGEQPQLLRAFGVWDMPFNSQNGFVRALVSGWALSGIFSYNSGGALNVTTSGCQIIGQGTCMPSYTPGYSKSPRINGGWGKGITPATAGSTPYVDASAFTVPNETYQVGNLARSGAYNLFGPGGFDLDNSLRRSFNITEKVKFVFQADAFNVTNAVHFGVGSMTVNPTKALAGQTYNSIGTNANSSFGTINRQSNAARDWQFSGRITF
ncbi:MAG: carboxypeptidase-like regulatory domain-containing protein [Acidobacteriaceae bacterium]